MIYQSICSSFRVEVLQALHDFMPGTGHTFKLALYQQTANLDANTTVYTTTGEIVGDGYAAGGIVLTCMLPDLTNGVGVASFLDATWPAATFTTYGGLIYNYSSGNRAIAVLNFGSVRIANNQDFTVSFPPMTSDYAIIRVS